MTTGGNCSARSTASTRLPRPTYGESRIRRLCPITGRWELSSLPAARRDLAQRRKEVDSEARILFFLRPSCRPVYEFLQRQCASVGAGTDLATDTDSEVA